MSSWLMGFTSGGGQTKTSSLSSSISPILKSPVRIRRRIRMRPFLQFVIKRKQAFPTLWGRPLLVCQRFAFFYNSISILIILFYENRKKITVAKQTSPRCFLWCLNVTQVYLSNFNVSIIQTKNKAKSSKICVW